MRSALLVDLWASKILAKAVRSEILTSNDTGKALLGV